jgi:methylmalonyl-CoA mutase, C-terminal domain
MNTSIPLKILVGKVGLDGHDRGAKVIARALRDAGMEVIYSGLHHTPDSLLKIAIEEDVDSIGLSILSGAHMTLFPAILAEMKKQNMDDVVLFGGGIIPDDDILVLEKIGVKKIFTPGTSLTEVTSWVQANVKKRNLGN